MGFQLSVALVVNENDFIINIVPETKTLLV